MTLLIFDIDGTLVYSERRDSRCFAETYQSLFRQPFPSIDWSEYPHVTDTTIFHTVFERQFRRLPEPLELEQFQEAYVTLLQERRRQNPGHSLEVPGSRRLMHRLRTEEHFVLGVATGGWRRPAHLKLQHVGITTDELPVEGADGKHSREEIINALLDQIHAERPDIERIIYIGDAVWDVATTRNLNMPFIGMRWRGDHEVLREAGATQVLSNYLEYEAFLEAVERAAPPNGRIEG